MSKYITKIYTKDQDVHKATSDSFYSVQYDNVGYEGRTIVRAGSTSNNNVQVEIPFDNVSAIVVAEATDTPEEVPAPIEVKDNGDLPF